MLLKKKKIITWCVKVATRSLSEVLDCSPRILRILSKSSTALQNLCVLSLEKKKFLFPILFLFIYMAVHSLYGIFYFLFWMHMDIESAYMRDSLGDFLRMQPMSCLVSDQIPCKYTVKEQINFWDDVYQWQSSEHYLSSLHDKEAYTTTHERGNPTKA